MTVISLSLPFLGVILAALLPLFVYVGVNMLKIPEFGLSGLWTPKNVCRTFLKRSLLTDKEDPSQHCTFLGQLKAKVWGSFSKAATSLSRVGFAVQNRGEHAGGWLTFYALVLYTTWISCVFNLEKQCLFARLRLEGIFYPKFSLLLALPRCCDTKSA